MFHSFIVDVPNCPILLLPSLTKILLTWKDYTLNTKISPKFLLILYSWTKNMIQEMKFLTRNNWFLSVSLSPDYYMTSTTTFPVMHTLDCVVSSSSSDDTGIFKIFIIALKNLRDSDCHQKSASNFSVRLYDENFENSNCKDLNDFVFFTFFANIIVPDRYTSGMNTCCFMRIACSFRNIGHY